jgi:hypothetical protein
MLTTFRILRIRWQEVLLIVGLQAASGFAFMQAIKNGGSDKADTAGIVPFAAFLFVIFAVAAKMLSLGFARTSFTDGPLHYEPWPLLKIGHHYFWRIIGFELLIGLITTSIMIGLCMILMLKGTNPETMPKEQMNISMLYCLAIAMLLMAKPMLFGPAAILVTDCGVFGAFGWLSWLRLFAAKKLLAIYGAWVAMILAPNVIARYGKEAFVDNYAVMAGFAVFGGVLTLTIYVMAVKAVGEVYLQTHHSEDGFGEEPQKDTSENQGGGK